MRWLPALRFSRRPSYAWKAAPVTDRDWADAHLVNAALEVQRSDPAFGYRFIAGELKDQRLARPFVMDISMSPYG